MSNFQWGPSLVVNPFSSSGAQPAIPQPAPEWQRWIAENLLLRVPLSAMIEAMAQQGFDRAAAETIIRAADAHPFLQAARSVGGGAAPGGGASSVERKLKKRDWVLEIFRRSARQATTFGQVPRVRKPSRQVFLDEFYARNLPVVIENALDDWPALTRWTPDYLKQRFGTRLVEVQFGRNANPNYEQNSIQHKKEMPFAAYVDLVESAGPTNDYYMTANNSGKNKEALRELWDDIVLLAEYLRPDPESRGFFWYGPQGTVTPLHHDLTNNFMAQVRGRKLVRLVPAWALADMYNHRHCFTPIDLDNVDYDRFPQFRNVSVIDVTIGPGDLLFLPVGWWHYVRGLDVSITMTFINFLFDNDFYSFYTTDQEI
jgi:hypothetical protein